MKLFTRQGRTTLLLAAVVIIGTQTAQAQQQNYTGNGGKEISLTIYVPQSTGLAKDQSYVPALVQGEFVSNFSNYSAISILDWERLDDIYVKLINEAYDDNAEAKRDAMLGRLTPTSHFLTGNITKTATGYNIKMNITKTADKMTVATYSGTFSFAELDNLTGIRRASLELLQKVGVTLTENARQELAGAAEANQVSAQTALAKGVTAQRAGTEVAALSYYFQAASFNPALKEAVKRSSITAANIKSGNIGADVRNDILWRKNWVAKLKETEEAVHGIIEAIMKNAADPPFTLIYFTDIKTGNIDYQTETADLSITIAMIENGTWFTAMRQTLDAASQATQAVLDGLNATNRKEDWKLSRWPRDNMSNEGMSNVNPFGSDTKKQYDLTVVFELVNQHGRVIGSQTVKLNPTFNIEPSDNGRFTVVTKGLQNDGVGYEIRRRLDDLLSYLMGGGGRRDTDDDVATVTFEGVKADNISDNMTIRVASINGAPPQNARFAIIAGGGSLDERIELINKVKGGSDSLKGGSLTGSRSRAGIQRVVMQNMAALRYAYNKRLREKPGLTGKIMVKFAIDEFGRVTFANIVESTMGDSELEQTVVSRVRSWNFEKIDKPGDITEVVYPFVFSSSSESIPSITTEASTASPAANTTVLPSLVTNASVFIATLPPNAEIYIDGRLVGRSNEGELQVPSGTHQIRYVKDRIEKIETITFNPGKNPTRFVNLK